jgi:hypothetical protein
VHGAVGDYGLTRQLSRNLVKGELDTPSSGYIAHMSGLLVFTVWVVAPTSVVMLIKWVMKRYSGASF